MQTRTHGIAGARVTPNRIAQDLHDYVMTTLMNLDMFLGERQHPDDAARDDITHLQDQLRSALMVTNAICSDLRPGKPGRSSGCAAICAWLEMARQRGGVALRDAIDPRLDQLAEPLQHALLLILREIHRNILDHAQADLAEIRLVVEQDQITLTVHDNGVGFHVPSDLGELPARQCFGLFSIAQVIRDLQGDIQIRSRPGHGTWVHIMLPAGVARGAPAAQPGRLAVLLADGSPIRRAELRDALVAADIEVAGEVAHTDDLVRLADTYGVDAVVLAMDLPGSRCPMIVRQLRALPMPPAVLLIAAAHGQVEIQHALAAGAVACAQRSAGVARLAEHIRAIALDSGRLPTPSDTVRSRAQQDLFERLSGRERAVLQLLVSGQNNIAIGNTLYISERTVRFHLRNIYDKLQMRRGELIAWGAQMGLTAGEHAPELLEHSLGGCWAEI